MAHTDTTVLVAGGGTAGLSTALFLRQHNVACTLVERCERTSIHPRARGILGRTGELFRELGLDDPLRAAGAELGLSFGRPRGETLRAALDAVSPEQHAKAQEDVIDLVFGAGGVLDISPTGPFRCPQEAMEPILLAAARERGADVRFATELTDFQQDEDGVSAMVADRKSGTRHTIRADYLVAADGAGQHVRERLGIGAERGGPFGHMLSVLFHADLAELVRGREFGAAVLENPKACGVLRPINNTDRWVFLMFLDLGSVPGAEEYTPARCAESLHAAIGVEDLDIDVQSVLPWTAELSVADTFAKGRVFLAGDAAHRMPPWRGQAATIAVQDAHNLAWKIAAVHAGKAYPSLLSTYDAERRPVALEYARESILRDHDLTDVGRVDQSVARLMGGGGQYASAAVLPEDDRPAKPLPIGELVLDGRPGTRVPHAWVEHEGRRISTLDLTGRGFVLLAARDGSAWCDAVCQVAWRLGADLTAYRVDPDAGDPDERRRGGGKYGRVVDKSDGGEADGWAARAGLTPTGALLVRPDGIVGWRCRARPRGVGSDRDPRLLIAEAYLKIVGRP